MSNYLVTGAAGFIASRVSDFLLSEGHRVVGIDNLCTSYDVRIKEYRLHHLQKQADFSFFPTDIVSHKSLNTVFSSQKFDAVLNLAAMANVRASVMNPWAFVDTNLTGTLNLLEMCRKYDIQKFVLASTSSIYGAHRPTPISENDCSDQMLQPYAASKKAAEDMCFAYHHLYGIDITVFRYFTVYGPVGRPDMATFRFMQWIKEGKKVHLNGDGNQSRGYTYVDDVARGTIKGLRKTGFEIINLGGHEVITLNEMIARLENLLGEKAVIEHHPFNNADMVDNHADVSKAFQLLAWEPQINLNKGLELMCDWYIKERDFARQIVTSY